MKISILPDLHLGYGEGTELENDAFDVFEEAIQRSRDCDLILILGDMFDTRNPSTDTVTRAMQILLTPALAPPAGRVVELINKEQKPLLNAGIPVVAINGNHERRARGLLNPVQALERAGFLLHLHCNGAVVEKDSRRVCIQGMSSVPDQYAEAVLKEWNPRPVQGCTNIFLIHQNIDGFVYAPVAVAMEHLPKGFDLYLAGHIHEPHLAEYAGAPFLIAGSTITTQIKKESAKPNGFWKAQIGDQITVEFVELSSQRPVHYIEVTEGMDRATVEEQVLGLLARPQPKKPLVKIKMTTEMDLTALQARVGDRALLVIHREVEKAVVSAQDPEEHALSVEERGMALLQNHLQQAALDPRLFEAVFELLVENKLEEAMGMLQKE